MKGLILSGGRGTRLRSKVSDMPKAMAPIAGKPFLEWQMMLLKTQGFTDVVLCVGYMADKIIDYFDDGSKFGLNIQYSVEKELLGTAGAILNASEFIDDTFLLLNGDTFFDIDYQGLFEFHDAKEGILTLSLTLANDATRYGSVSIDMLSRITGYKEKQADMGGLGYINAGVYAIEPSMLDYIKPHKTISLENDVIPTIMSIESIFGYVSGGYFIDIGTPGSYEEAQKFFKRFA